MQREPSPAESAPHPGHRGGGRRGHRAAGWLALALSLGCGKRAPERQPEPAASAARPPAEPAPRASTTEPAQASSGPRAEPPAEPPAPVPSAALKQKPRRVWTTSLASEEDFNAYSKEQAGERFTKFVVNLRTEVVYYIDVDVYKLHKDFIFAELFRKPKTPEAVKEFDVNYTEEKADYLMCNLVHHLAADVWTMSFWEGDRATADHVMHAYRRMKATFYAGDKVAFRPDSNQQERVAKQLKGIAVITNDQLYKSASYQVFNKGTAVGVLRVVPAGAQASELSFSRDEIVILPEALPDITPVAGILSETFSTPLSHASLRARAWGIPNAGLKGASKTYGALAGKTVWLSADESGHTLREATAAEIDEWKARARRETQVDVAANLEARELLTLDRMRAKDAVAYGAKAANLGEIVHGKPGGFSVPAGFGVPIAHYDAHMKAAGLDRRVEELLADPGFKADAARRREALAGLRAAIVAAPLDAGLRKELGASLSALVGKDATRGVFVRSSTNAEDLPGFNGAGLYDTVANVKGQAAVEEALKAVWASVWNLRAYEEREHYRIDHRKVYGAALVQIGVNATAAGVLVTAHPTDPSEKNTYTINAKSGLGIRVVEGTKIPESLLYNSYNHGLRVLSRSDEDTMLVFDDKGGVREVPNPQKGQPVLSNERGIALGMAAQRIVKIFASDRPLDIEWLFEGSKLHIVQARPYVTR